MPVEANGGFLVTQLTSRGSKGEIAARPCDVSPGLATVSRKVTCNDVTLALVESAAWMRGSRHGWSSSGFIRETFALTGAVIKSEVTPGIWDSRPAFPGRGAEKVERQFLVWKSTSDWISMPLARAVVPLGTVTADVPAYWDKVVLEMPSSEPVTVDTTTCADPSTDGREVPCENDPALANFRVALANNERVESIESADWQTRTTLRGDSSKTLNAVDVIATLDGINEVAGRSEVAHVVVDAQQDIITWWGEGCDDFWLKLYEPVNGTSRENDAAIIDAPGCSRPRAAISQQATVARGKTDCARGSGACEPPDEGCPDSCVEPAVHQAETADVIADADCTAQVNYRVAHTSITIQGVFNDDLGWLRGWAGYGYGGASCPVIVWGYNDLSAWAADSDDFWWWSQTLPVSFEVSTWATQPNGPVSFAFAGHFQTQRCPPPLVAGIYFIDLITEIRAYGDGHMEATSSNAGHCSGLKYPSAKKTATSTTGHYGGRTPSATDYYVCIANPKYGELFGERCDSKG